MRRGAGWRLTGGLAPKNKRFLEKSSFDIVLCTPQLGNWMSDGAFIITGGKSDLNTDLVLQSRLDPLFVPNYLRRYAVCIR